MALDPDEKEMLSALGLQTPEELFSDVPPEVRTDGLRLSEGLFERELVRRLHQILEKNRSAEDIPVFLGAGLYDHFIPAAVKAITSRSEFYTSYTPYQAEISQGILQALFEYQSLICELTGMDAANTSMYDGSTALGEAALMAARITGTREILIPRAIHWEKRSVLENYAAGASIKIKDVKFDRETGKLDLEDLKRKAKDDKTSVYFENPNFFGIFEDQVSDIRAITKGLMIVGVNPLSLAIARAPGGYGADIVIGESQALGNPMNFGGPLSGIFACKEEHIRKMPGRVIGLTKDAKGQRAFCMTLQTREQHIRREKAMSNICTNETLNAIASAAHMAILGADGLRGIAEENVRKARSLSSRINAVPGFHAPAFSSMHFNEFVVKSPFRISKVNRSLLRKNVHGGLDLTGRFRELGKAMLLATTEVHTQEDHEKLISALEAVK